MSNFEKIKIYEDFSQLNFVIRILCVIDVLRLKINIIDVNLIIQWKESFSLRAFMQRVDRATKDSDRIEEFIWFHSIWCKKERSTRFNLVAESSQFRNVTNANELKNKFNSKTKMNDEKKRIQIKKKAENRKTANEKRAQMKDILWRIINKSNELTCIRKLILLNLNESNLTRRSYQNDCCFVCTFFEKFTFHIQTYRQSRSKKFRATTLSHVRETIKETLKKWRDEKRSSVFRNNFLVQDDNYEFFLNNDMIKNMIKNVHLIKTMNDFRAKMTSWAKDWLNK